MNMPGSYLQRLRARVGDTLLIHPAARIIIENERGQFLVVERTDNGRIGLPAGALEAGETIEECIQREVREETGLRLRAMTVIGISTQPERETVTYPNGDRVQYFTIEFYSDQWTGTLQPADTGEVKAARFVDRAAVEQLPPNEQAAFVSLAHFRQSR